MAWNHLWMLLPNGSQLDLRAKWVLLPRADPGRLQQHEESERIHCLQLGQQGHVVPQKIISVLLQLTKIRRNKQDLRQFSIPSDRASFRAMPLRQHLLLSLLSRGQLCNRNRFCTLPQDYVCQFQLHLAVFFLFLSYCQFCGFGV